jgi:hypothetical protein
MGVVVAQPTRRTAQHNIAAPVILLLFMMPPPFSVGNRIQALYLKNHSREEHIQLILTITTKRADVKYLIKRKNNGFSINIMNLVFSDWGLGR